MTQYNTSNVKLSNPQLNKLKSGVKNGTEVTLNLSLNLKTLNHQMLQVILMLRLIFRINYY